MGRHGAPRRLLSDRGANFLSSLVREVCFLMNTHKVFTTSYHPQCDGLVERFNGTMAQCISHYVDSKQKNWDMYLNVILFAFRTSPNEVRGESPFFMLYGRDPIYPLDCSLLPPREVSASVAEHRARVVEHIEIARRISAQNIQRAQQRMKDLHDRFAAPTQFQLGDRVWVYCPKNRKGVSRKLAHNYHGPYRIVNFSPQFIVSCVPLIINESPQLSMFPDSSVSLTLRIALLGFQKLKLLTLIWPTRISQKIVFSRTVWTQSSTPHNPPYQGTTMSRAFLYKLM